ncbi:MAG TPA: 4-hydroxybenzoate octaprenyltransferase [Nitrospirota bacterium]|nr:4-hydroxybenzoate octaprenyltransferase [Nitrospirota bacterium]
MEKLKAVADLIRLDKQYGTLLLMLPVLWSLVLASEGMPSLKHIFIFVFGSFIMRSAGCVINDMADRKFDRFVERTKGRPLASGRLRMTEAVAVLCILLLIALTLVLSLNRLSMLLSLVALLLTGVYPFTKRIVNTPQLFLGTAFGWGAIIAWGAVRNEVALPSFLIFLATIFWATGYDTIYALIDIDDDMKIGVKSTAILFGGYTWLALVIIFLITIFILFVVGRISRLGNVYVFSLFLITIGFMYQVFQIKRGVEREGLLLLFKSHVWIGMIVLIGIVSDLLIRSYYAI